MRHDSIEKKQNLNEKYTHTKEGNSETGDDPRYKTRLGLNEEDYVRAVAKGNYTPSIQEIDDLIIDGKIKLNEAKLLLLIKKKTIAFRNTEVRARRKDLFGELKMAKPKFYAALESLVSQNYLIEQKDQDDYYFYSINPFTFGGTIVLRSVQEASHRINVNEKKRKGTYLGPVRSTKKGPERYQKGTDWVTKRYPEEGSNIQNYSGFQTLKYIVLKYIYKNMLSHAKGEFLLKLAEETKQPEWTLIQFASLLDQYPLDGRALFEELMRAYRERTDAHGRVLVSHPIAYLASTWSGVRFHYQNIDHRLDMSPEAIQDRKDHFEIIRAYPLENNVVSLKTMK